MVYKPGRAYDIGVGGGKVWVVGTGKSGNGKYGWWVYQRVGSKWIKNSGTAARIAVDEKGMPYVVQRTGHMYRFVNKRWARINGLAGDIGVGGG